MSFSRQDIDEFRLGWQTAALWCEDKEIYNAIPSTYHSVYFPPGVDQGDWHFGMSVCGIEFKIEERVGHELTFFQSDQNPVDCIICLGRHHPMHFATNQQTLRRAHRRRAEAGQLQVWVSKEEAESNPNLEIVKRDANGRVIRRTNK